MDPDAIKVGRELEAADGRFAVHHSAFGEMGAVLGPRNITPAGVFFDLGISSPQSNPNPNPNPNPNLTRTRTRTRTLTLALTLALTLTRRAPAAASCTPRRRPSHGGRRWRAPRASARRRSLHLV